MAPRSGRSRSLARRGALAALGAGVAGLVGGSSVARSTAGSSTGAGADSATGSDPAPGSDSATGPDSVARDAPGHDGETTEITTVAWRGRPVRTAEVPVEWYARERRARSVLSAVRERYADVPGVVAVALGDGGASVAGRATSSIDLHVDPEAGVDARLPASFAGVPGRIREATAPEPLDGSDAATPSSEPLDGPDDTAPLPAPIDGPDVTVTTVGGSTGLATDDGRAATATCRVAWRGGRYLLTCAHLFEDDGCDGVVGRPVHATGGRRVGRVVACDPGQDWALVEVDGVGVGVADGVAGVRGRVCGRVTPAGLHHLRSEGTAVFTKGHATPERAGRLRAVGVHHGGCDVGDGRSGSRYVDVDVPTVQGDSGSPVYHRFERGGRRYLAVVGLVSARVDAARVSAAYGVHRRHGVSFAPAFPFRERTSRGTSAPAGIDAPAGTDAPDGTGPPDDAGALQK